MTSAIVLQAERYRNLQPFTGDLSQDADEYIEKIESIGSLTEEPDAVLHILLQVKLCGRAEWWYKDNRESLGSWSQLRIGFQERFQQPALMNIHSPSPPLRVEHHQSSLNQLQTQTSPTATLVITIDSPKLTYIATHPPQIESFEDLGNKCLREHDQCSYSAMLIDINDPDLHIQERCTDETDDLNQLKQHDEPVLKSYSAETGIADIFVPFVESIGSLIADDSLITPVAPQDIRYLWFDKRRLRKPRIFKKFHTGYDWNQYNKKHHDTDNPPAIIIQDCEFHMFYSNLNHPTTTSYNLTIFEDTPDFSTLPFHPGSPYDDIGFKIVCKKWDYSYNHSFQYHFPHTIVQLWFYFRKWKYRSDGSIQSVRTHLLLLVGGLLEDDIYHPHSLLHSSLC